MEYKGKHIKIIGNFNIIEEMNKGEKYKDYLAIDNNTGKLYIAKVIENNDKIDKDKLNEQLNLLKKKDNIGNFITGKKSEKNFYIIIEYFNGGNLKNFQKKYINENKSQLPERFIRKAINQIISQIIFMYNKKEFYRNIKLENIFINFDMYENKIKNGKLPPKINYSKIQIDNEPFTLKFGNFFHFQDIEKSENLGVQSFMSPEMAQRCKAGENINNIFDEKNDIWSIGVLTYELLTGKKLFEGNNSDETYNNIINGKYTFPTDLKASKEIISFIIDLLQYFPEKRLDFKKIRELPFLEKDFDDFNFIDLSNKKNIEIDSKEQKNDYL